MSHSELMEVAEILTEMKQKQTQRAYSFLVYRLRQLMQRMGYLPAKEARRIICERLRVTATAAHRRMSGADWKRFCKARLRVNRRLVFCQLAEM